MPVRTTKIDIAALARTAPAAPARSGGGVGSFGLGVAPPFTGFDFQTNAPVQAETPAYAEIGRFLAEPYNASTTYELVDDLEGAIGVSPDGEVPFEIDEDGYLKLFTTDTSLQEGNWTFQVRATLGMQSLTFTVGLIVEAAAAPEFDYVVQADASSFNLALEQGDVIDSWQLADERLTLASTTILTDTAGVFEIAADGTSLARGAGAAEDGVSYDVEVQFTFAGDDADPATVGTATFSYEAFSIG